jgi:hypothetical protein
MPAKAPQQKTQQKKAKVPAREAAKVVLLEAGRPMHYREITQVALEQGIVKVRGGGRKKPNPDATMKTIRSFLAGTVAEEDTEFVRVDPGVFDLKPDARKKARAAAKKVAAASAKAAA